MTISRVKNACKPLILLGLQKNKNKISTRHLTVLIISVIVQIEQRKRIKDMENRLKSESCVLLLATLETVSKVLMAAADAA